jgi:hypothetical protein
MMKRAENAPEIKALETVFAGFEAMLTYLLTRERAAHRESDPAPLTRAGLYTAASVLTLAAEVAKTAKGRDHG